MTEVSTIQRRFTVTIPKEIRKKLKLKEGMSLQWDVEEDKIIVQPVTVGNLLNRFEGKLEYTREIKEDIERLFVSLCSKESET